MARLIVAACGVALLACTVWAIGTGDLFGELAVILDYPWGTQVLADLYVGFTISAVFIYISEKRKVAALCWIVPIYFLGNIITFVWALTWLQREIGVEPH